MSLLEQPLPSTVSEKMRNSNRMVVKNWPSGITRDEIASIFNGYGPVKHVNIAPFSNSSDAEVVFGDPATAWKAYEGLQNFAYNGFSLQVEFSGTNEKANKLFDKPGLPSTKFNNFPLRILVPTPFIGAIIGKKGHTIKALTTKCKARIDVHGKENAGFPEKMISIYGQIDNRTLACKEILKILDDEDMFPNKSEAMLKMLANDSYCGRLIGKEGRVIKKIKEDTGTRVVIANSHDIVAPYPDRVISIFGSIDGISAAESALSNKLAKCLEADARVNPFGLLSFHVSGRQGITSPLVMPSATNYNYNMSNYSFGDGANFYHNAEACQVCIPNSAVGSMIGTGGANIRQMMKDSMASIFVEPKPANVEMTPSTERIVTIKGSPTSCWKACYLVFEKMKTEGFCGIGEAHLKTVVRVPAICIGRLIGKSGKNIKEIQKASGTIIRIPHDNVKLSRKDSGSDKCSPDKNALLREVPVEISGNFQSVQVAHYRVKACVNLFGNHSPRSSIQEPRH